MTDIIITVIKMIIALLPFLILCFVAKKVNLADGERSKQFPMPLIALIYVIFTMIFIGEINDMIVTFLHSLPFRIAEFANVQLMPEFIRKLILDFSAWVDGVLKSLNLNFWVFFLSNAFVLGVFLAFKKFCLTLIKRFIKQDSRIHEIFASPFYTEVPDLGLWCVMENYSQARDLLKVFYYGTVVISSVLMLVSRVLYDDKVVASIYYPVFGVILVGEIFFYLNAKTRREMSSIYGEDEDSFRTVNYTLIRKYLRSLFSDKLLTENTSVNNGLVYSVTNEEVLKELEKSEDQKVVSFATYFSALNKLGFDLDHNYLYSSLDLLNGKSILFNNPFYNDLIPYAFYPMNRVLLSHKKVLIVLGRHAIEKDIEDWVRKGIESVTNIPFMWNVGILTREAQDLDIGIISRSDVHDIKLHEANSEFLENVEFFVVLEPSKLISTAQIGLNLIVKKCKESEEKNIVYCLCDKNCDGLVDAMSHVLMASITEVSATNKHKGTSSYMCWEADGDYLHHRLLPNISRYLGLGTELSFAGLKNQVAKAKWYGGETFPVVDIRWIDKQYYYELMKFAGLPTNQEAFDEHFITSANFWSAGIEKHNYFTVEDESFNMFEILRDFSTRSTEQGFINVISTDYLLKDYMADNATIFETDAKAIPYIVADYARTNRNVILRLVLMMSTIPVSESKISNELSLIGIKTYNLKKQLWYELYKCYADSRQIASLPEDYRQAVQEASQRSLVFDDSDEEITCDIFEISDIFNLKIAKPETVYSITNAAFIERCVSELRSAGYVAEDEKGNKNYLGSELYGHIYQKYLPGQFFTFAGKYYEMRYLTATGEILVRRAAEHINGRPAYRQIREYTILGSNPSAQIGAYQNIAGMRISKEYADIRVATPGYYRMDRYHDFASGKKVSFEGERNGIPERVFKNKEILKVELPDPDGLLTEDACYTITMLFNEIFRTLFAENQPYIVALCDNSFIEDETDVCRPLTYSIRGDGYEIQKKCIYIIEDSQLDLGLTVAVERNLERIFKIVDDYLDWHDEAVTNSLNPPGDPEPPIRQTPDMPPVKEPPKSGAVKLVEKIKEGFGKKKGSSKANAPQPENAAQPQAEEPAVSQETPQEDVTDQADLPTTDETEAADAFVESEMQENPVTADEPIGNMPSDGEAGAEEYSVPLIDASDIEQEVSDITSADDAYTEQAEEEFSADDVIAQQAYEAPSAYEVYAEQAHEETSADDAYTEQVQEEIPSDDVYGEETANASSDGTDGDDWEIDPDQEILFNIAPPTNFMTDTDGSDEENEEEPEETEVISDEAEEILQMPEKTADNEEGQSEAEDVCEEAQLTQEYAEMPSQQAEEATEENADVPQEGEEIAEASEETADEESEESSEAAEVVTEESDENAASAPHNVFSIGRKPYHNRYYLLFGDEQEPGNVNYPTASEYVSALSPTRSPMRQARDGKKTAEYIENTYKPGKENVIYCDFCGAEIYGVEYETLADGRDRCLNCSRTAIKTEEEFKKIFEEVKRNMESAFSIKFNCGIRVEMVNAKTLHKRLGHAFVATPGADGRILGVAIKDKNGYTLLVENGSPRMASMLTMAHELTHIWQYQNWNDKEIRRMYGDDMRLEIYEGMAKWVEIQYAYLINEPATAKREEIITSYRNDEYGRGFLRYRVQYPFSTGTIITKPTPFERGNVPLGDSPLGGVYYTPAEEDGVYDGGLGTARGPKKLFGPKAKKIFKILAIVLAAILIALFMLATKDSASTVDLSTTQSDEEVTDPTDPTDPKRDTDSRQYAYELLNDSEKKVYKQICEAIENFDPAIEQMAAEVDINTIDKIVDYIAQDCPQYFWMNSGTTWHYAADTKIVSSIDLTYCYSKTQVETMQGEIDAVVNSICSKITENMSDYEILLTAYESLVNMIDYDNIGLEAQEKAGKLQPGEADELRSIYGAFVNKKSVCVGYARATQYILQKYGIECVVVNSIESEKHAWNLAKIDGDYYYFDTTWGDGSNTDASKHQFDGVNYDYLCITSQELSRLESHTPEDAMPVPDCTADKCNYYKKTGRLLESADYEAVQKLIEEAFSKNEKRTAFKCTSEAVYKQMKQHLITDKKMWDYINAAAEKTGVTAPTEYSYSMSDELYVLTLIFE